MTMKVLPVSSDESIIKTTRLEELEHKERAHDAYMRATNVMRVRQIEVRDVENPDKAEWCIGYLAALREFAEAVVRA